MDLMNEPSLDILSDQDRAFVAQFDDAMRKLGFDCGGKISSGYCWGKYMLIYTRTGVKSKQVYARVYIREKEVVLRLFLNDIDRHRAFLESAPDHIKQVFTGPHGDCQHCHNEKYGRCRFRKTYTLENRMIEKCSGVTFEFQQPDTKKMGDYLALFSEFFPARRARKV